MRDSTLTCELSSTAGPAAQPLTRTWISLLRPADIQGKQPYLQENQRICLCMPTPDGPQHVAGDEPPEAPVALAFGVRSDEPGSHQRRGHCWPLHRIQ